MKKIILSLIVFTLTGIAGFTYAQDRHFSWTYESTTLPKGAIDIEPWVTFRTGRENFYNKYETRLEFETGITNKLQTALYLNTSHKVKALTDENGNVIGLGESTGFSFSNEWKLNVLDPSVSPVGFGVYGEYGISADEVELEFKLLFDKKTPKSIIAYNFVTELEFEKGFEAGVDGTGEIETEKEFIVENDLAYMYMVKPNFGLGLELRNHNVFVEGEMEHAALFGGPTLYWSQKNFFAIVNAQPQLTSLKGNGLDLNEYEKVGLRVILGISF